MAQSPSISMPWRCDGDLSRTLSADNVQSLLAKHVQVAGESCPSLKSKRVSPHVLRHSAAMELLQAGVDCSVIALWFGHESIETAQAYLHAHLALKEAALARLKAYQGGKRTGFRPNDRLLAFLACLIQRIAAIRKPQLYNALNPRIDPVSRAPHPPDRREFRYVRTVCPQKPPAVRLSGH